MEPEVKKFDWQRLLITVGIVIITAGAIGGSVYYVMNLQATKDKETANKTAQDLQKQIDELKKVQTSTITTIPTTTTIDPIASWKTYSNTKYGFSLKYPADWTISDTNATITNGVPAPNPDVIIKDSSGNDFRIYIASKDSAYGWGMETIRTFIRYDVTLNSKKITLSGRTVAESDSLSVYGGTMPTKGYYVTTNDHVTSGVWKYRFNGTGSDYTKSTTGDDIFAKIIGSLTLN